MTIAFWSDPGDPALESATVFLSASIPDPARWDGPADPLQITDAVVAFARVFLTAGAELVTAAHPTIAPLLLYVAAELPVDHPRRIVTYQSGLFDQVMPAATRRFQEEEIGRFVTTPAVPGERPVPGEWDESLLVMRRQMLRETQPRAAVFVGGMEGITAEFSMFSELFPGAPTYPIGRPGGEAARLARRSESPLAAQLLRGRSYPALWRSVLKDLAARQ
jgi:hypothetical protein